MNPFVESVKVVWENPRYVFVNERTLEDLARKMANEDLKTPAWREEVFPESDDQIVDFFGVANAINFCFTDFKTGRKFDVEYPKNSGQIREGAFAMAACLKRALEEGWPVLDPTFLININERQVKTIFRHHATPIPMLAERVNNLTNVGWALLTHGPKTFQDIFERCQYRLFWNSHGILETLPKMFQSYSDVALWDNGRYFLQFQKRAQLLAMVYQGRALSSNGRLPLLQDADKIGPIADYQVARTLRFLGVLCYHSELAEAVDAGQALDAQSVAWIEIRALTVRAMCLLLEAINKVRKELGRLPVTMIELDYAIWSTAHGVPQKHPYVYTTAC